MNIINVDAFDRARHESIVAQSEKLSALRERGSEYPELMEDVFGALYKTDPQIIEGENHVERRTMLRRAFETQQFQTLRDTTELDEFASAMGEMSFIENADDETQGDFESKIGDALKQELKQIKSEIEKSKDLPMTDSVLKAMAKNSLRKKELNTQINALVEMRESETRNRIRCVLKAVQNDVDQWRENVAIWGNEDSQGMSLLNIDEKMSIASRLKNNRKLIDIAKLAGRFKRIAMRKLKERTDYARDEINDIEQGDEIARMLCNEIVALKYARMDFMRRFADKQLMQYKLIGNETKGDGSFVVCIDNSSSMRGNKEIFAKAVAVAIAHIAQKEKRKMRIINFSTTTTVHDFNGNGIEWERLQYAVSEFHGGGTSFETPLREAFEFCNANKGEKRDVIMITDGACEINNADAIKTLKDKTRLISIYIGGVASATLDAMSDVVARLTTENGNELFDIVFGD